VEGRIGLVVQPIIILFLLFSFFLVVVLINV
jgi:hypothetical protein